MLSKKQSNMFVNGLQILGKKRMANPTKKRVFVVGVGLTKFERPLTKQWDYPDMGREAGMAVLYIYLI